MGWAEGEGKRLDERLLSFLGVVQRWSSSGAATRDPGEAGGGGCLHPLNWLKFVVFLLAIVLLPLTLFLFVIIRLATGGLAGLASASAIDTAGGEPARLGHGVLEPVAGVPDIRAAIAAIVSRDPGFRASALTDWAAAAVRLLCQSVTSADAAPARTFMANGLFRTHQALLELRSQAGVSCEGSWAAADAAVVQAIAAPQFDEVRIRVSCQGWRWERHGPTGLSLPGRVGQCHLVRGPDLRPLGGCAHPVRWRPPRQELPVVRIAAQSRCRRGVSVLPGNCHRRPARLGAGELAARAMVTGLPAVAAAQTASGVAVVFDVVLLVILGGSALLVAALFLLTAVGVIGRRASQRRSRVMRATRPDRPQDSRVAARLAALHRVDPDFDEQLLLEAAQTASLLIFAAMSTGEEALLRALASKSFWATSFGRSVALSARERRREDAEAARSGSGVPRTCQQRVPLDYQASVPEFSDVELGAQERVSVRIAFSQLSAVARPGAAQLASATSAASVRNLASAVIRGVGAELGGARAEVSWISVYGHYDLVFARQAGTRTDPSAALSSRTCPACGATYRSELVSACSYCGAERPPPWGQWRLASARAVR